MARYLTGECVLLNIEEDVYFCEIISIQAHGNYYVSLTDGTMNSRSSKYPDMTVLHHTLIEEHTIHV